MKGALAHDSRTGAQRPWLESTALHQTQRIAADNLSDKHSSHDARASHATRVDVVAAAQSAMYRIGDLEHTTLVAYGTHREEVVSVRLQNTQCGCCVQLVQAVAKREQSGTDGVSCAIDSEREDVKMIRKRLNKVICVVS
jgi:hypothetical protein